MTAEEWKKKGDFYTVLDKKIFVIEEGTSNDVLVILNGYPTASFDYVKVLPELSKHFRVIIHDHLGFGFSDKPKGFAYSLVDQADFALRLWDKMGLNKVSILAHDYGTSVAKEILTRKNHNMTPLKINKIILCNSSQRLEYKHLKNIGKLLNNKKIGIYIDRLTTIGYKNIKNRLIRGNDNPTNQVNYDLNKIWDDSESTEGREDLHLLSNFISERYTYWHRWVEALRESKTPIKIIWENSDPLSVKEIAIVLATNKINENIEWIENTKHYSILESPGHWVDLVFNFYKPKMKLY